MRTITWVNIIHIYQPPWQDPSVVRRVTDESYRFLVSTLERHPSFRITLNIAGTLLATLAEQGYHDLIADLKRLVERNQVELTGSSYSHAFLPLLPDDEIKRQIEMQDRAVRTSLGIPTGDGFFLPEMAYSHTVGAHVKAAGYRYLILDPMSARGTIKPNVKYLDRRTGLTILFRNRKLSRSYPPEEIYKLLQKKGADETVITASDGELYGHFHKDWQEHLQQILTSHHIHTSTVSDYLAALVQTEPVYLRQASWETRSHQLRTNNPFSIWFNRSNPIHKKLWQLAYLAIDALRAHSGDPNVIWARTHLDRGLASCSWWWASEIKTSAFGPLAWSPDEVERGALELIKSIRSLPTLPARSKIEAEKLYADLLCLVWTKHWTLYGKQ